MKVVNYCNLLEKCVTIGSCWDCRLVCVDNPNLRESCHQSLSFIARWGFDEIQNYAERRRDEEEKVKGEER